MRLLYYLSEASLDRIGRPDGQKRRQSWWEQSNSIKVNHNESFGKAVKENQINLTSWNEHLFWFSVCQMSINPRPYRFLKWQPSGNAGLYKSEHSEWSHYN